ncbi:MAG: TlpA disulfide reductase family protein [Agriterribacter sp.]
MKRLLAGLLPVIVLYSCANKGKLDTAVVKPGDSSYTVTGKISGLDTGWVLLYNIQKNDNKTDSAKLNKGQFEFKGFASEPQIAVLALGLPDVKPVPLMLFLEAGKIEITASKDSMMKGVVTGTPGQADIAKFNESLKPFLAKQKALYDQYQAAATSNDQQKINEIQLQSETLESEYKALVGKFVKENPASYLSPFQLLQTYSSDMVYTELEPLYSALDPKMKDSYFGKKIKVALDAAKTTAIGSVAPDFTLNDVNGKPVSLASFKGKYTLVDFWASWCAPCRAENPNVVKAYNTYKAKGFEILGVSLDDKKENWQKAIQQDKLTWTHVSDLKGWQSDAAALYDVKGIPMNFLLDKDGKIIAKSLRGEDLEKKLSELLN